MKSWSMSLHWCKASQARIIPLTMQGQRNLLLLKISGFIKLKEPSIISMPSSYCSNQIIMYTNCIVQYVVHWMCLTVVFEGIFVFINDKCKGTFIVPLCAFMHGVQVFMHLHVCGHPEYRWKPGLLLYDFFTPTPLFLAWVLLTGWRPCSLIELVQLTNLLWSSLSVPRKPWDYIKMAMPT